MIHVNNRVVKISFFFFFKINYQEKLILCKALGVDLRGRPQQQQRLASQ